MKKIIIIISGLILLGIILGGIYVYINVSDKPNRIVEQVEDLNLKEGVADNKKEESVIVKRGGFIRIDKIHYAQGEAVIEKDNNGNAVLNFKNFKAADGPDLFVYLSKNKDIDTVKKDLGEIVSLGELKKAEGDQSYNLPSDYADFNSVVIWCRAFDVNFSSANLN